MPGATGVARALPRWPDDAQPLGMPRRQLRGVAQWISALQQQRETHRALIGSRRGLPVGQQPIQRGTIVDNAHAGRRLRQFSVIAELRQPIVRHRLGLAGHDEDRREDQPDATTPQIGQANHRRLGTISARLADGGWFGGFQGARLGDTPPHIASHMQHIRGDIFMRVDDEHRRFLLWIATNRSHCTGVLPQHSIAYATYQEPSRPKE